MDPPAIMWERTYFDGYYSCFRDIHETADGGFVVAVSSSIEPSFVICRLDYLGNTLWTARSCLHTQVGYWEEELDNGNFIVTGAGRETSISSVGLLLAQYDSQGDEVWTKIYGPTGSVECGYCVTTLPDGGFAVCGEINPQTGMDQAWLLRTDSNGDTLWTDIWGEYSMNHARRVIYNDGLLKVLSFGRIHPDSAKGTHLLTYDLNGNLLSEVRIAALGGDEGVDMCYSPSDGGYTIVTNHHPKIAHVDSLGNLEWIIPNPMASSDPYGWSINATMDGGYIYGGENTPFPIEADNDYPGMVIRIDSEGNQIWWDFVYESDCTCIYSIRQLSQGGYIAAGQAWIEGPNENAMLIRYEPETGIGDREGLPHSVLLNTPCPNPFTSSLSIEYSLPERMCVSLSVYDLTGRLAGELEDSVLDGGEHTSVWYPGELPSGCYIVMLRTEQDVQISKCVLVR